MPKLRNADPVSSVLRSLFASVKGRHVPDRGLHGHEGAQGGRPAFQARLGEGQI